eukprot:564003-Prorocentrum_lima.AAC.1
MARGAARLACLHFVFAFPCLPVLEVSGTTTTTPPIAAGSTAASVAHAMLASRWRATPLSIVVAS